MNRLGASATALALLATLAAGCDSLGSRQGYQPPQPIAFSHAIHAGKRHIACLYCHFGAERSRYAGVPPVNVCMNCHSQILKDSPEIEKLYAAEATDKPIEWIRVDRVPDFVYFQHAAHIQAGLQCQQCHGPVETMDRVKQVATMSMGWCLTCHRDLKGKPRPSNGPPLDPPTDCSTCHH